MKRLPHVAIVLIAVFSLAAEKKPEKAKDPAPSAAQIQQWVKQLGDDDFKMREEATRDLIKAGGVALDAVVKASKSEDPEVKQRALRILKQIEKAAIAYFKKLGCKITVDKEIPGKPVTELALGNIKITDAGMVHLTGLTRLRVLYLSTRFGSYSKITDAGLVHLKGLAELQKLILSKAKVTDAGLVHLNGLAKLQMLGLSDTQVTDDGLVHLKGLAKLLSLDLSDTQVTGAGLVHLNGLAKFQSLNLSGTQVTDAELVHLNGLTNLQNLDIGGTQVTDAGLGHLKELTKLRTLDLSLTQVTRAGIEKLQKAMPRTLAIITGITKLSCRTQRKQLVAQGGGSRASEDAVEKALKWIANHQNRDGGFSFKLSDGVPGCTCPNHGTKGRNGATGMALLPFLGAGYTHQSKGKYKKYNVQVGGGLNYLLGRMKSDGSLFEPGGEMYSHGLAACALAEAYGMTEDSRLRAPAQAALDYIIRAQDAGGGGWRYRPGQKGDTSVGGWQLMALHSGVLSRLNVPKATFTNAERFLDSVSTDSGYYGYTKPGQGKATTAIGHLGKIVIGVPIGAQFPYIPVHIVKAIIIRLEQANRGSERKVIIPRSSELRN